MRYLVILFIFSLIFNFTFSQDNTIYDTIAIKYASTITSDELKEIVYFLASDSCQGRETGKTGQKVAAAYIARYFKQLGLHPIVNGSYFQSFPIYANPKTEIIIKFENKLFDNKGIFFLNGFKSETINITEAVYAGLGIQTQKYNSYDGINAKNKAVFLMDDDSIRKSEFLSVSGEIDSDWLVNFRKKVLIAEKNGASIVFFIIPDNKFKSSVIDKADIAAEYDMEQYFNHKHIPYLFISESVAKKWLYLKSDFNKNTQMYFTDLKINIDIKTNRDTLFSENVLGYIEGTDLKHEIVVITAHYDHLGTHHGKTYYGADDNGSGTAAILEIAEAFSEARKDGFFPRRSILIMPVSGEEKGLLGSAFYTNNPVFPLKNTIVNLNIDMIGRIDTSHIGNPNYVYLIGSDKLSYELHKISEQINSIYTNLYLDYTYNDPNDPNMFYYRSDHYNFAKNNIPVIFYFSGIHEDYHKPTDTPDKLNYKKIEKIAHLVFYTAWHLSNRDKRPEVDKNNEFKNKR